MDKQTFTCIGCPMGCELTVKRTADDTNAITVEGQACKIGEKYGKEESINPTRNITTSIRIENGDMPMLSVKTSKPVPKGKIMDCVKAIHGIIVQAPVQIGDVVLADAAGTGADVVATREVKLLNK